MENLDCQELIETFEQERAKKEAAKKVYTFYSWHEI